MSGTCASLTGFEAAKVGDSRWMHRLHFDWAAAEARRDMKTPAGRTLTATRELALDPYQLMVLTRAA